jgi:uncharacterized repeat protein (TIGR02543 family)
VGRVVLRRGLLPLLALLALVLGVGNAGGRILLATTVTVQVIGVGTVTSSATGSNISCGDGNTTCHVEFTGGSVTLTAINTASGDGWAFSGWGGDCTGSGPCTVTLDGTPKNITANFGGPGADPSTLSVSYTGQGTVTASANGTTEIDCGLIGTGTPAHADCSWTVPEGSILTVVEAPDGGYVFSGWSSDCSGTQDSCTVTMQGTEKVHATWTIVSAATQTLTVTATGNGKVRGGGIDCPGTCVTRVPQNSFVTLTAEPDEGYTFTGWGTPCIGTGRCTINVGTAAATVTATFAPTLAVEVSGNGNVTGGSGAINCGNGASICSGGFAANATVTLVATAASGATFTGWTGACGGTATTCTVLMSQSKKVSATFTGGTPTPTPTTGGFTLTVSVSGNGSITGGGISCGLGATTCTSPNHAANTTVTLTATPGSGATFTGWGGSCTGTTTTCTVTFNAAKAVTATFSGGTSTFQLSVSVSGAGSVSGGGINCGNGASTCTASLNAGTIVSLTATPASGATFTGWGGACSGTGRTCTVTANAAKSVSATFTGGGTAGTLTIVVGGRGSVSTSGGTCSASGPQKTCTQRFKTGAKVALNARPAAGGSFLGWGGACATVKTRTCTVTLSAARSVSANFSTRVVRVVLASLAQPVVNRSGGGFQVTLRFRTSLGGLARVRGLRAGRVAASVSLRVAAGPATIGPFPVLKPGLYVFELRLAGRTLRWKACLGVCGSAVKEPPWILVREPPTVTRAGDVWAVTLHLRSNLLADDRVRAYRGTKLLVNQHFLGRTGEIAVGPFLLGPGSYTLRITATDAYGRVRTLSWIVALAR